MTITASLSNGAAGVSANVTVSAEGGEVFNISNQCGYRGGNQTQPNACTMPAGQMEMNSSGWYCTNNPNFDVTIPWTLPAGVPIITASVSAEFVRGGETVYNHGTELSLNNTQIGNATVPQQANPAFNVPSSAIIPGARSQSVNLRSLHTNDAHYTLTTNFTITVQHGAYETRQCFAPGVVNTSSLLAPACAPVYQQSGIEISKKITDLNDQGPDDFNDGRLDGIIDSVTAVLDGESIEIQIDISNTNDSPLSSFSVIEMLPEGMDFISYTTTVGDYNPETGEWIAEDISEESETLSLEIIAQISAEAAAVNFDETINNTVTISSYQPNSIPVIKNTADAQVVIVPCEGRVTNIDVDGNNVIDQNDYANTRPQAGFGSNPDVFVGNSLPAHTEVGVLGYVRTTDPIPSNNTDVPYRYGWFQLTDSRLYGVRASRYIAANRVEGCDDLTYPLSSPTNLTIGTDLNSVLPPPPDGTNQTQIPCTPVGQEYARRDCASQVYVAFYEEFKKRNGTAPTVRDLIAIFLTLELNPRETGAPPSLLTATAANVYYGTCGGQSQCNLFDVIDFLQASDGWIQIGDNGGVDPVKFNILFDNLTDISIVENLPDNLDSLKTYNNQIPIAWGNYFYNTEGYQIFRDGADSRLLYCEVIQGYKGATPVEYLFVITNTNTGNPLTNYDSTDDPPWYVRGENPVSRKECKLAER